jgi:hypothetical protein
MTRFHHKHIPRPKTPGLQLITTSDMKYMSTSDIKYMYMTVNISENLIRGIEWTITKKKNSVIRMEIIIPVYKYKTRSCRLFDLNIILI